MIAGNQHQKSIVSAASNGRGADPKNGPWKGEEGSRDKWMRGNAVKSETELQY